MNKKAGWPSALKQLTTFLLFVLLALFLSRQLNTWLGRQALEATGLKHLSMEQAQQLSSETGKPILAKFAAIWCGACRQLDVHVFSDDKVKKLLINDFHYVRLEYEDEEDQQWFKHYGVTGFPTIFKITGQGKVERLATPKDPDRFIRALLTSHAS